MIASASIPTSTCWWTACQRTPLLDGIALAEATGPLPVDLKRLEDFSVDLSERLLRQSQPL